MRSLFARVVAILLAGLAAAYGLSYWAVQQEKRHLVDSMMSGYVARDVASSLAILERVPADERSAWLQRLARPNYRWVLGAPAPSGAPQARTALTADIASTVGADRVQAVETLPGGGWAMALRLADGSAVSLQLQPPARAVTARTAGLLLLQLLIVGACTWWAVRQATRPLARLGQAARLLARDANLVRPLPEDGPREVREAAAAFNAMQHRIAEQMRERLHILAAVSHDLQTPITRMRVRTDLLADAAARRRLQADLSHMQSLVEEGLAYARTAHAAEEPSQAVDLHALLDTLVCDFVDDGHVVRFDAGSVVTLNTRPLALRRIVSNLLDNAVKHAGAAEVRMTIEAAAVHITVLDRGPGIPEARLAEMKQPFRRLEESRSRDTGGSGLGLAIAERLSHAIGAELHLKNRPGGGLEAQLVVPSTAAAVRQ
ncbi:ATP-binding protein [Schlegelella sp. S2-27]|uniref:histidine kinase n=1 Tax=Caldimonas mangrovi TaxID=2944811 RepID=A0ABT0YT13_9BURK|nr:ATP-binding protein [Caldimonas mangrovi]MCM5681422.1 ATP-binding protein [Caldimonas mangrovi]